MEKISINKVILSVFCFCMVLAMAATIYGTAADDENLLPVQPETVSRNLEADTTLSAPHGIDIIFVLDNSGSMKKNDPGFITRKVVINFMKNTTKGHRFGMVTFDDDAVLVEPLADITTPGTYAKFLGNLDKINYKGLFTNSPAGVERALYEFKTNSAQNARKVIILLTDGIVDTGNKTQDLESEKWLKEQLAGECKEMGIHIFSIAFADKADFRLLQILASKTDGAYFRVYTAEDIPDVFQMINEIIINPPQEVVFLEPVVEKIQQPEKPETNSAREAFLTEPVAAYGEKSIQAPVTSAQSSLRPLTDKKTSEAKLPTRKKAPEKKLNLLSCISYIGVILILLIIFFLVRAKRKKQRQRMYDPYKSAKKDPAPGYHPLSQAELIDVENTISTDSVSLVLNKKTVTIGRDSSNDIMIPKEIISNLHATIEYQNGYYYLEDNRSTNGTSLNNKVIKDNLPARLKSGDTIHFAKFEFRFLMHDQAPFGETVMLEKDKMPG